MTRTHEAIVVPPRLLRVKQCAAYLGTSTKDIRRLIMGGELPFLQRKHGGNSPYKVDVRDLDAWIDAHKIPLTPLHTT
jgi:excisionase family DNA binding protein